MISKDKATRKWQCLTQKKTQYNNRHKKTSKQCKCFIKKIKKWAQEDQTPFIQMKGFHSFLFTMLHDSYFKS
jgi:hypothetical protein